MISEEMFRNRVAFDNPWWEDGAISENFRWVAGSGSAVSPRQFLDTVYSHVSDWGINRAILLLGPRRVGKTWLMHHMVARLLENRVLPQRNVIFISVDVPVYHNAGLEELLHVAAKVSGAQIASERCVVCFDEIQYLKNWEVHLKTLVEAYPNIKFAASGSAATVLMHGSAESGAGRFTNLKLPPLSFAEYLRLTGREDAVAPGHVETRDGAIEFPAAESMEELNRLFVEYVNYGGYPELATNPTARGEPGQFVQRDIVDKVLMRDLPSLYHIEDVRDLQAFFSYLAYHSGMVQSWESLSKGVGLPKSRISNFLRYLEDAFLIARLDRVDINAAHLQRATQFKTYLTNPSLRASMFGPLAPDDVRHVGYGVESAISAQFGIGEAREGWRYANWKSGRLQGEVDFVRISRGTLRPDAALEVKWSDGPYDHVGELAQAIAFCRQNGLGRLWVTTRSQRGVRQKDGVEIVYAPAALFAYRIGKEGIP